MNTRYQILYLFFSLLLRGQNVTLLPDIGLAQAEYRDAMEKWMKNDPDLEKDLMTGDPERMRRRVKRAAALSEEVMAKRKTYLDLIIQRLRETRAHLPTSEIHELPLGDLKASLKTQQENIVADRHRVERLLLDLNPGEESVQVRRALESERSSLLNLQNALALRMLSLDILESSQAAVRAASYGDTGSERVDELLKIWNEERAALEHQKSSRSEMYRSMEHALDERLSNGIKDAQKPVRPTIKQPASAIMPGIVRLTPADLSVLSLQ